MRALFSHSLENEEELIPPFTQHMAKLEEAVIFNWLGKAISKLLLC
jgi:hypothetical protein